MLSKYLSPLRNSYISGGVLLTLTNLSVGFMNYLFNIIVAKSIGPQGFGEIATLNAYLFIMTTPLIVISTMIIKKIGSATVNRYELARSIEWWMLDRIRRWWVFLLMPFLLIPFIPNMTNLSPIVAYSLIPLVSILSIGSIYDSLFQSLHWFKFLAFATICAAILKLAGSGVLLFGYKDILLLLVFIFLSFLIKMMFSIFYFHAVVQKRTNHFPPKLLKDRIMNLVMKPEVWFVTVSLLGINTVLNLDVIAVKKTLDLTDAGLYSAWNLLAKMVFYIFSPVLTIAFIYFSDKTKKQSHQRILYVILACFVLLGVIGISIYILFGRFLIAVMFGSKFIQILPIIPYAAIFGLTYISIALINSYYIATKSRYSLVAPLAIIGYVLLFIVIPKELSMIVRITTIYYVGILMITFALTIPLNKNFYIFPKSFFKSRSK